MRLPVLVAGVRGGRVRRRERDCERIDAPHAEIGRSARAINYVNRGRDKNNTR